MKDVLRQIIADKYQELKKRTPAPNRFAAMLETKSKYVPVIAEVKLKSPSEGILYRGNPLKLVKAYERGGAAAISVVTDQPYFGGSLELFTKIRTATKLPLLRKDFIINEAQIFESARAGADALLLITAALPPAKLERFIELTRFSGMLPIVEVSTQSELKRVLKTTAPVIAVNARNLRDQTINNNKALMLLKQIPHRRRPLLFSGILTAADIVTGSRAGARGMLVGTALLRAKDPAARLRELRGR